jgi:hypothetical protein
MIVKFCGLTKKNFFSFRKLFTFLNFVNYFPSLSLFFSNHRTSAVAHFLYKPNTEKYFALNKQRSREGEADKSYNSPAAYGFQVGGIIPLPQQQQQQQQKYK